MSENIRLLDVVFNDMGGMDLSFLWHDDVYTYSYRTTEDIQEEINHWMIRFL